MSTTTKERITLKKAQPFVKWAGGKRGLLAEIEKRLPKSFNNYFEPFVGGGALFFSINQRTKHSTIADSNLELILAYKAIQKEPEKLIALLKTYEELHDEDFYYRIRKEIKKDPLNVAARFLYLNKTCYNGLYRVNRAGLFNVPMGKYKNPAIVQGENIMLCHESLRKTDILCGDFELIKPEKEDFVYFDPPYHPTGDVYFTEYTKENFTESDQVRLRDYIATLHRKGVFVMLSNSKTKFIEDLFSARYFKKNIINAPRFINCKPGGRNSVEEFLITNY